MEAEGRSQDDQLDAASLLEDSATVTTETQESVTERFTSQV